MTPEDTKALLEQVAAGRMSPDSALERLKTLPYEDLGYARVDHHRQMRQGHPEVIFGAGKSPAQIVGIARAISARGASVLATRVDAAKAAAVLEEMPELSYIADAGCLVLEAALPPAPGKGVVAVVAAGTSDLPVAREAVVTARLMGSKVEELFDVGVAGLHRLLSQSEVLARARALVVVAGMEGALPSVVAGLVAAPVIAVPSSVGYGASFGGLAALLGMLNSCASGLSVVNIDNGFGAGFLAAMIDHLE